MRTTDKPNCRGRQLGSRGISFERRYRELTTHVFMVNDSASEMNTGSIQFIGGTLTMTLSVERGDV